jgi:hypothetical protein
MLKAMPEGRVLKGGAAAVLQAKAEGLSVLSC